MGSGQSATRQLIMRQPDYSNSEHYYGSDTQMLEGGDMFESLPDDATGDDVVWKMRKMNQEPWQLVSVPKEDDYNPDLNDDNDKSNDGSLSTSASQELRKKIVIDQYMTHWCSKHKGWSVILEEQGQPVKPITGGYKGAMKGTKYDKWDPSTAAPLIARCPGGTSNPGGWVRAVHCLPRNGRHYWEVQYIHPPSLPGKPLEGTFMTGVFSNKRTKFDWNSGISHFWGSVSGRWRRKSAQAVLIQGGSVRTLDDEYVYDLEDEVLNEEGVVYGHGDKVGILVDMDEGWMAFFRGSEAFATIPKSHFPSLEYDWWPCCRPFAPGSRAILDFHCKIPQEALDMDTPSEYEESDDSDDDSDSDDDYDTYESSETSSTA